jgi:hypothetical protein
MEIVPLFLYIGTARRHRWQAAFDRETAMEGKTAPDAWKVDGNHVYPINDLREHSLADCWCRPIDDDGIIGHNSLDGRELYECGERQMS